MSCQPELSWRPPVAGSCHSETANKWSQSHGMRLTSNRIVFRWDSTPPELRILVRSLRTRRESKDTFRVSKTVERGGQRTEAHAKIRCFTLYRWETESTPNLLLLFGGDSSSLTFRLLQLLQLSPSFRSLSYQIDALVPLSDDVLRLCPFFLVSVTIVFNSYQTATT